MALTAAQKQLRADIKRANARLATLNKAGVKSPAAERALTALGGAQNFNLGAKPSAMREMIVRQAVKKFLKSETSTVKGYKAVEKKRRAGAIRAFREYGVTASESQIERVLKGTGAFRAYAELLNISTDDVQAIFAESAEMGIDAEAAEARLNEIYGKENDEIEVVDTEGDWWDD